MTTYYADFDLGTGDNDGGGDGANRDDPTQSANWTNAWKTMDDAIAGTGSSAPAAGDIVYCRGTDTLGSTPTNAISGSEASGFVKWIGVNSSGNNDGTRAVLDCDGGNFNGLTLNAPYNLYENFEFANSGTGHGVGGSGDNCVFINCSFHHNTYGFYGVGMDRCWLIRCTTYENDNDGIYFVGGCHLLFCSSHDNSGSGFDGTSGSVSGLVGCLSYDNSNDGFESVYYSSLMFNCVANGNTDDGVVATGGTALVNGIIGCRITNQSGEAADIGLNCNSELVLYGWNYIFNNGDNIANDTVAYAITHDGTATNTIATEGEAAANIDGYTSITDPNQNFNLASDATLRREPITIPTS